MAKRQASNSKQGDNPLTGDNSRNSVPVNAERTRREFIKLTGAATAGALLWVAPSILSVNGKSAYAALTTAQRTAGSTPTTPAGDPLSTEIDPTPTATPESAGSGSGLNPDLAPGCEVAFWLTQTHMWDKTRMNPHNYSFNVYFRVYNTHTGLTTSTTMTEALQGVSKRSQPWVALNQQSVAALANARHPDVSFPWTARELRRKVRRVYWDQDELAATAFVLKLQSLNRTALAGHCG